MQFSITEEEIHQLEKSVLTLLYSVKNKEIQRYNRLQLALHAMHEKFLPSYQFRSRNKWGPADEEIRNHLNLLCGEITSEIKRADGIPYVVYRLTPNGVCSAERLMSKFTAEEQSILKHVAHCIDEHPDGKSLLPLITCLNN